jgi:endonuclease G
MKRIVYSLLAVAALLACTRIEQSCAPAAFKMKVSAGNPTKTVVEDLGANKYNVLWQAGDRLAAIEKRSDADAEMFTSAPLSSGGPSAQFSFTLPAGATSPSYDYSFVYPASALGSSGGKYYVTIPSTQVFAAGSFDPEADVLVSEHLHQDTRPSSVSARFARLGGTARMTLRAPSTTETIQKIIFSTTGTDIFIAGSYEIDPATGDLAAEMKADGKTQSLTLTPASSTAYSGDIAVWFRLAEVTLSENFTVSVITAEKTYTKTVYLNREARSLEFRNSALTTFGVDMTTVNGVDNARTDVIDAAFTGITSTSYNSWSGKQGSASSAVYAGHSNKRDNGSIGLRTDVTAASGSYSGIVTTTSGGTLKSVTLELGTYSGRAVEVYAKNTPYTSSNDLFDNTAKGTLIATVNTSSTVNVTETVTFTDEYAYVGVRSRQSAIDIIELSVTWEGGAPKPFISTGNASEVESNTAKVAGSFTEAAGGIYEAGFYYGTAADNLSGKVSVDGTSATQGSFEATIGSLSELTQYYFKAYIVWLNTDTNTYEEFTGSVQSFTTTSRSYEAAGWLELPGYSVASLTGTTDSSLGDLYNVTHTALMGGVEQRNYTILYDPETYISYWVAYPLCRDHMTSGRVDTWGIYDPKVPQNKQVNLSSGYGVSVTPTSFTEQYYARGHQIPNADRNNVVDMQTQTYYPTNMTPQLQNGFNGGIWMDLESAVRSSVKTDTVYVVTGAAFYKKGQPEAVETIDAKSKNLPVPNYYWKALLKVRRDNANAVNGACAVGFWLEHREDLRTSTSAYQNYTVSVDQLEEWTGLDLFKNLPVPLQTLCESTDNWTNFVNY